MNNDLKYSDVLKKNRQTKASVSLTVICNTTLEPMYTDFLRYYAPRYNTEYIDIYTYMNTQEVFTEIAVIFLTFSELNAYLYDNIYTMKTEEINEQITKTTELLSSFIYKVGKNHKAILFFSFAEDFGEYTPFGMTSYNDIIKKANNLCWKPSIIIII